MTRRHGTPGRGPRGLRAGVCCQVLESRRHLDAAPAELVAALPREDASINMNFEDVAEVGGRLFATAWRERSPETLFVADGAGGMTPLFSSVTSPGSSSLGVTALTPYRGKLYFFGNGNGGDGLYVTDGTPQGTQLVRQLRQNQANVLPSSAFVLNDRLHFFWADVGGPVRLWRSDGMAAGTEPVVALPRDKYATGVSPVINGTHALFSTSSTGFAGDNGELWRTDGTAAGTEALWELPENSDVPKYYTVVGDKLFFVNAGFNSRGLYVANLDGTRARQVNVPDSGHWEVFVADAPPVVVGDKVLFQAPSPASHSARLFATDGTDAGTVQLAGRHVGIYPNGVSAPLAVAGDKAVFVQTSIDSADQGLFVTDGTPEGTRKIASPNRKGELGGIGTNVVPWFSADGKAYFYTSEPIGIRLYQSDGTAGGTRPLHYIAPGYVYGHQHLATLGGRPHFEVSTYGGGHPEIWAVDPNVPTGAMTGMGYFDLNRNNTREGFEHHLSGSAYIDVNDNAVHDVGELLRQAADNNRFVFDGLPPGHYVVRFNGYGVLEGAPVDAPAGGAYRIDLLPGQTLRHVDFGSRVAAPAQFVWGALFNDADGDGARDADEAGQGGQQVYLDLNNDGVYSGIDPITTTAADGTYGFGLAAPGTYTVRRKYGSGFRQTAPAGRGGVTVTVAEGQVAQAAPIGVIPVVGGTVVGAVFNDRNNDAVRQGNDTQQPDVLVYLDLNGNSRHDRAEEPQAISDRNGLFTFANVVPGDYTIRLDPSYHGNRGGGGLRQTSPADGAGLAVTVRGGGTAAAGEFLVHDPFLPRPPGAITGMVFSDRDGDGARDAEEFGIPGRTVWIDADNDGQIDLNERRDVTDGAGRYSFANTPTGSYTLRQVLPAHDGWAQTSPAAGAGRVVAVSVSQQQVSGVDFGTRSPETTPPVVTGSSYTNPPAEAAGEPNARLVFAFSEDLGATFDVADVVVTNGATGEVVPASVMGAAYATPAPAAVLTFPGLLGGALPAGAYRAVLKAGSVSDAAGNPLAADHVADFTARAAVTGRHVFYNNPSLDGGDAAAAGAADDAAVAADKRALLPGAAAGFANVTSFVRGLNGVMIDLAGLPAGASLSADDFSVRIANGVGAGGAPAWADGPAPSSVTVRAGKGVRGDRVTLTWPDGAIRNAWLEVTVKATADTGLAAADVFYFGNLVGETGDGSGPPTVTALDLAATRRALHSAKPADLARADFNRDGVVNFMDLAIVRSNYRRSLPGFTAPANPPASSSSAAAAPAIVGDTVRVSARRHGWLETSSDVLSESAPD